MRFHALFASAVLATFPAASYAQSVTMTSAVSLGFASSSIDVGGGDIDITSMSLDFESDIWFGSNVSVGLDFGITQSDIDIGGLDLQADLMSLAIEPAYHFGNGGYLGVYYRMGDLDLSIATLPITFGVDTHSYGVFGGYESGPIWVEAFVGTSDTDPGLPGSIDVMDYGIAASYDVAPNFEIFGSIARTDIDFGGGFDVDLTSYALGAEYSFNNGLAVYGSVGRIDVGTPLPFGIDATDFTLGLAYDLSGAGSGIPVNLNLEVSRTNLDLGPIGSTDIDRIGVGVTIPIGGHSSTPLNSRTSAARGDYRSVIAQLANSF